MFRGIQVNMVALLATEDAVTGMVCFVTLKDRLVNPIFNTINFEELEAKAIETILRNKARGGKSVEKGQAEDGEADGLDYLIHALHE
jgi:hypothetical protein